MEMYRWKPSAMLRARDEDWERSEEHKGYKGKGRKGCISDASSTDSSGELSA